METVKQKTVDGRTYRLERRKTDRPGKQYEYMVTEDGSRVEDPVYTRKRGMQEFRETISAVRRSAGAERVEARGPSLPSFGGTPADDGDNTGPYIPGFGQEDDDEDDGPSLNFL